MAAWEEDAEAGATTTSYGNGAGGARGAGDGETGMEETTRGQPMDVLA